MLPPKQYLGFDGKPIQITPDLATIFDYSADLCVKRSMSRSYTSVLLCFSVAPSELCRRFRVFVRQPTLEKIAERGAFSLADVSQLPDQWSQGFGQQFPTWGANLIAVFAEAAQIAMGISKTVVIDVRHLMAAYIYDSANRETLKTWDLDPEMWAAWFQKQIAELWPDEAVNWRLFHKSRGYSSLADEDTLTPYFATDQWTTNDRLGYSGYAYAFYRFLVHKLTVPPLAVSIQAPWGGGKTSFMKMIRNCLDPDADSPDSKQKMSRGALTIADLLANLKQDLGECTLNIPEGSGHGGRITVWLNAWKYESSEQIWAGLADAIVSEISRRFKDAVQRERFWLKLNLARVDAGAIRTKIYSQIAELAVAKFKAALPWLIFAPYWGQLSALGDSWNIWFVQSSLVAS